MQNKFRKFKLFQDQEERLVDDQGVTMLINLDHLVSLKPINVPTADGIVRAYWLRLSNGKKYKATTIPEELATMFESEGNNILSNLNKDADAQMELH